MCAKFNPPEITQEHANWITIGDPAEDAADTLRELLAFLNKTVTEHDGRVQTSYALDVYENIQSVTTYHSYPDGKMRTTHTQSIKLILDILPTSRVTPFDRTRAGRDAEQGYEITDVKLGGGSEPAVIVTTDGRIKRGRLKGSAQVGRRPTKSNRD